MEGGERGSGVGEVEAGVMGPEQVGNQISTGREEEDEDMVEEEAKGKQVSSKTTCRDMYTCPVE